MSLCAVKRLSRELRTVETDPPPYLTSRPLTSDILTWYFVIRGPEDTPYETGIYMGKLVFPEDYPFKPPGELSLHLGWAFFLGFLARQRYSTFVPSRVKATRV